MYEVELVDGRIKEYGANIIVENMLTQVDSDGFSLAQMEGIIDSKCDDLIAIPKAEETHHHWKRTKKITENHGGVEVVGEMEGPK